MKLSPLIVALDVDRLSDVKKIILRLGPSVNFYKVGLKLFTHYGPEILTFLKKQQKKIFLDLKFHDIPNTVAEACREAVQHRVDMLTLHACGGSEMMKRAVRTVREESKARKIRAPLLLGVTVLTSMDDLGEIGVRGTPVEQVKKLAKLAFESKLDGVICSPHEISVLRKMLPKTFKIVTPGVRPLGSSKGDQRRVKTPEEALSLGADAVVMGRPIFEAKDPLSLVQHLLAF